MELMACAWALEPAVKVIAMALSRTLMSSKDYTHYISGGRRDREVVRRSNLLGEHGFE